MPAEGDLTDEHPKQYTKMRVIFEFTGRDLPVDKLERAVAMSQERYCGVGAVYRKALEVTTEVRVVEA